MRTDSRRDAPLPIPGPERTGRKSLLLPELAPEDWCDFRRDYESGMSCKAIAEKYICDPRTVRQCLLLNKSSGSLGKQTAPTKLAPYIPQIRELIRKYTADEEYARSGICSISRIITEQLRAAGYTGSERTVRNYLRASCQTLSARPKEETTL